MNPINLLPRARQERARARRRAIAWSRAGAAYALCVLGACGAVAGGFVAPKDHIFERREALEHERRLRTAEKERADRLLSKASRELGLARLAVLRPDWSVLLRVLAERRGEGVALSLVELGEDYSRPEKGAPANAPPRLEGYTARLGGVALTQQAITGYVLELEGSGIFDDVRLKETRAKSMDGREGVAFEIMGTIRAGAGKEEKR